VDFLRRRDGGLVVGGVQRGERRHAGGAARGEAGDGRLVLAKMGQSVPTAKEESGRISWGAGMSEVVPRSLGRKLTCPQQSAHVGLQRWGDINALLASTIPWAGGRYPSAP
jgi:hypothetical protein